MFCWRVHFIHKVWNATHPPRPSCKNERRKEREDEEEMSFNLRRKENDLSLAYDIVGDDHGEWG